MPKNRRGRHLAAVITLAAVTGACPLCQNMRNEFISFRGAFFCETPNCKPPQMVRSSKGTDKNGTRISYGKLQPSAALVFNPGAAVETFKAKVTDCKGKSIDLPDSALKKPGSHKIKGEGDSWIVMLDKNELGELHLEKKGKCAEWIVTASATWPKGTSYEDRGGVKVE